MDAWKIEAGKIVLEVESFESDRVLDAVANAIAVRAKERQQLVRTRPEMVMISSRSCEEIAARRALSKVRVFLRKPISRSTLLDTIVNVMRCEIVHPPSASPP